MGTSQDHVAPLSRGFITVRIMQLVFALTIFCLSIFMRVEISAKGPHWGGWESGLPMLIGTSAITCGVLIYIIIATYATPRAYNYWAILVLELVFLGLWSLGFLLSFSPQFKTFPGCIHVFVLRQGDYVEIEDCTDHTGDPAYMAAANARWAVMGFSGSLLLLWFVSFIVVTVGIARHRKRGATPR
ncbi:uncharacterized protein RSE6_09148 [Rhynchosporium secalis]|uniref:MARVEL domain-containing protein n=1 Tax=Rhynchosporium secalis TaxID=38038 RepID=A0A1E1MIC1_RHYSE|nr:uncharacterized protein RSE6_09148 [Rhynchosporium secalis]